MFKENEIVANRFKIIERIAFGAFSIVYKCLDEQKKNEVCLKIEKIDEDGQSMLKHEFLVAKSFNSLFLCKTYEYFEVNNYKMISMEILGENLIDTRRKRKNPPSIPMLMNVTFLCLKSLAVMHNKNYVHSDAKPSNFAFRMLNNNSDYSIVLYDFGLSQYEGEDPIVTNYRDNLTRNPRYLSLHTHTTKKWTKTDDIYALIYSMADFWRNELPWDGRTTNKLVYEVKNGYDLKLLLPPELHILIENADQPTDIIIQKLGEKLSQVKRNVEEEMHYILDPVDPGMKPKLVKYVFEKGTKEKFTNQHSA